MSSSPQTQASAWRATSSPAQCDAYEQAFMRTVLSLHGIQGEATPLQLAKAKKILRLHGIKVALSSIRSSDGWLGTGSRQLSESAGVEHAFMYVRFDSVLPPDAGQVAALNSWLGAMSPVRQ